MRFLLISSVCLLAALPVGAQTVHPNLSGTWKLNAAKSELNASGITDLTLQIEQKGVAIHIVKTVTTADGKQTKTELRCTTDGKSCDAGDSKVSLWFDGAALVEMESGADALLKSSMKLRPGAKSMSLDITPMVPAAEADKLLLEKL
jgi:hypothetical protein